MSLTCRLVLSCQQRVTVTSCFVYKVIEDIYFFKVNTKYISSSVVKNQYFSRVRIVRPVNRDWACQIERCHTLSNKTILQ